MGRIYLGTLFLTLTLSGAYLYSAAESICPTPIAYTLGVFDERFALSKQEAKAAIAEAEALWEETTGRDLFVYTESTDALPVNFIFDDRQERTIAEEIQRESLDSKEQTSEAIAQEYEALTSEYAAAEATYRRNVDAYEARLETFNQTVERFNAAGGAPPDEFAALEREEKRLQSDGAQLDREAEALAQLAEQINQLSERGNRLIEQYNNSVQVYNRNFGHANEFTQGDFQGTSINIYTFTDRQELITVLAHELGHALSIGHVENEASVMYYLMGNQPAPLVLSSEDLAAFTAVCGQSNHPFDRWRRMVTLFVTQHINV
jgi:hypothetical protein